MAMNGVVELSVDSLRLLIMNGLPNTILLSLTSFVFTLVIGVIGGVMGNASFFPLRLLSRTYVYVFRNITFLIFVYVAYYGLPQYGINLPPFPTAVLALIISHGAYMTEIVRGGLNTLKKEQIEAGISLGLTYPQRLSKVILPQVIMEIAPSIVGQTILLIKDTSVVSIIGLSELTRIGRQVTMMTHAPFTVFLWVALLYFVLCYLFQRFSIWTEKRVKRYIG
jgi:His/Glu/Gln/Arg/opine family amino acid ABC transporter permease subunit